MSLGHLASKFNIVSNDHGHMQKCKFLEYQFWVNLVQNIKFKLKFGIKPKSGMQNSIVM